MNTNSFTVSGILLGVGVSIVILIVLLVNFRTDKKLKAKYDERQELIRGKGYKYAFFITIIYYGVFYLVSMTNVDLGNWNHTIIFAGIILGVIVYADYAIINDGYFALNEKSASYIGLFSVLSFINIFAGIIYIVDGIENNVPVDEINYTNMLAGLLLLEILIVLSIKKSIDSKESREE